MNIPQAHEEKLMAAIEFIRRTGAASVEMRYSDDNNPVVWMVVAEYDERMHGHAGRLRHEVDAALDPVRAALRLCKRLADGGQCKHCGRPTGFEPDSLETMPLNEMFCWYQYDPELKKFRRGCE